MKQALIPVLLFVSGFLGSCAIRAESADPTPKPVTRPEEALRAPTLSPAPTIESPSPTASEILAKVWQNLDLIDCTLEGVLRNERSVRPVRLWTKGRELIYEFPQDSLQLRVQMDPRGCSVSSRTKKEDPWGLVTPENLGKSVLGTDLSYDDLRFDFIRWKQVTNKGLDSIKTIPAWFLEAKPSPGSSVYSGVRFWIARDTYAFLRVDGINDRGEVIKRVEVNGVQRRGDAYILREMQFSTMIPGRELSRSRTYLEIR